MINHCYTCGSVGHRSEQCRNQPPLPTVTRNAAEKRPREEAAKEVVSPSSSKAQCYACGALDHMADQCPRAQTTGFSARQALGGGSEIVDVTGDLMTADESLCHCVSECLAMGKGIAVLFKQRFGRVEELKAQAVKVGGVAPLEIFPTQSAGPLDKWLTSPKEVESSPSPKAASASSPVPQTTSASSAGSRRFAYYLITKPRYFDKPTYATLQASLVAMFAHMVHHNIKAISMPEIGSGLDGLDWGKVREMVAGLIDGKGIRVTVYHFKPAVQMYSKRGAYSAKENDQKGSKDKSR